MTGDQWIEAFAQALERPAPSREEIDAVLNLAATAAHDSERTAAPVAAWLAGLSGKPLAEVNEIAPGIADKPSIDAQ